MSVLALVVLAPDPDTDVAAHVADAGPVRRGTLSRIFGNGVQVVRRVPTAAWHEIAPGQWAQNGIVESFNGLLRDECLNEHLLTRLVHPATRAA